MRGGDGAAARGAEDTMRGGDASVAATVAAAQAETLSSGVWKPEAAELPRGAEVGRYVILGLLGSGGTGVVYAAYDPELDRKVALKLVRDEPTRGPDTSDGRTRLLREAQALARLSHPNVVAVHDAGTLGDRVWLAMEHVEGVTLRTWAQTARPWPELLGVMIAVGHGLAAAHAAGLVHRDVKPDNIMIGVDGRARVTDFGLARAAGLRPNDSSPSMMSERLSLTVTRTGATIGTPAYMAPEQWVGKEADARTDQFAYGISLWEVLFGERPFAGDTLVELAPKVLRGELRSPPRGARAPTWLRRAVARALQAEPERRWPDMRALMRVLEHGQTRARRWWIGAGFVVLAAAAVMAWGWQQRARAQQSAMCAAAGAEIATAWDEAARAKLEQALRLSGVAHAATTYTKVVPWIDRWTGEWARVRAEVCAEATVAGTRPMAELAVAEGCLAEQRGELEGLLAVLGDGDRVSAARAVPAVASLTPPSTCADPEVLARRPAPPDDAGVRARALELGRELMRVRGLGAAGRRAEGARRAAAVVQVADELGHAPLAIRARLLFGALTGDADLASAEAALMRAYAEAGAIGADELAAAAATELIGTVGVAAARAAEGLVWGRSAAMFVARLGRADSLMDAEVELAIAEIHALRGATGEALPRVERALALRERWLGPRHPQVAATLGTLAGVHRGRGEFGPAQRLLERALEIQEEALGPDSPQVAATLGDLAAVHLDREAYAEAERALERALPIQEAALGAEHPEVGVLLGNLASVLLARGEAARASGLLERSLHVQTQALGQGHPDVARSVHNLAVVRGRLGEHARAVELHERALAARVAALGPDHVEVLQSLDDLGYERRTHGELAEAEAQGVQALALRERVLAADHLDVAWSLDMLAEVRIAQGRFAEAEPLLVRSLAIRALQQPPGHHEVATTQVLLGRAALGRGRASEALPLLERGLAALTAAADAPGLALADAQFAVAQALGRDKPRARTLAGAAEAGYREAGARGEADAAAVRAWLGH